MSKLTESEGEYNPADVEDIKGRDKLDAFFSDLDSDPFFSDNDEEEETTTGADSDSKKKNNAKMYRDLAEGKNLNNSFGCYSPEDWDHLHVDKGANP